MEALNHQLAAEGVPVMRMRLGVHSGMLLAGLIGSSERLESAITGDTVTCASRIESLETDRHDGLHGQRWGAFQVKGRLEPLEIWELLEVAEAGEGSQAQALVRQEEAARAGRSGPRARSMRGLRRWRDRSGGGSAAPCDRPGPWRSTLACWNWKSPWRLG